MQLPVHADISINTSVSSPDKMSSIALMQLLIQRGFDANRVEAVGRGEREPVVASGDEVNEPKNRRAEIVVRALVTDRQPEGGVFVPLHWTDDSLPIGIQLLGPDFSEDVLLPGELNRVL